MFWLASRPLIERSAGALDFSEVLLSPQPNSTKSSPKLKPSVVSLYSTLGGITGCLE